MTYRGSSTELCSRKYFQSSDHCSSRRIGAGGEFVVNGGWSPVIFALLVKCAKAS